MKHRYKLAGSLNINQFYDEHELTQGAVVETMQVQRTRINDACNSRIGKMTIDKMVARLGIDPLEFIV